jgi:hypothetical protein
LLRCGEAPNFIALDALRLNVAHHLVVERRESRARINQ